MSGTAKTEFKNSVDRLRDQRDAVRKKLNDLKDVSAESWMSLKSEVDAAVADLERSYEQISASHDTVPAKPSTDRTKPSTERKSPY
jgi:hypothetical protein